MSSITDVGRMTFKIYKSISDNLTTNNNTFIKCVTIVTEIDWVEPKKSTATVTLKCNQRFKDGVHPVDLHFKFKGVDNKSLQRWCELFNDLPKVTNYPKGDNP